MFCMRCGKNIPDSSRVCPNCGFQLPSMGAAPNMHNNQNIPNRRNMSGFQQNGNMNNMNGSYQNPPNYIPNVPQNFKPPKKKSGCLSWLLLILIIIVVVFAGSAIYASHEVNKGDNSGNKSAFTQEEYKEQCNPISYDEMSRNSNAFKGKYFTCSGEISQEIEEGLYRLTLDDSREFIVIDYPGQRLLEDDHVTIWGQSVGFFNGTNILNSNIKVPKIEVAYLEKSEKVIPTFNIGETWTVDGEWSITIDSVTVTDERNEFSDKDPAAVYIVNYTYENLGAKDDLYVSFYDCAVDNQGTMGYSYPINITSPKMTPKGAKCSAQACIAVDNAGSFTINYSDYDSNLNEREAVFNINVE
nr:MAG TPA: zinc-ribbon domain protein [Caudoviricetes sp.]